FRKLHIRTDSPFYAWLEAELARRFDYVCCDELETFRRLPRAVTPKGQIKGSGQRHEKDDRRALGDRSHFVLGWSNASKIETFERRRDSVAVEGQAIAVEIEALRKAGESRTAMRDAVRDLLNFADFSALDWRGAASEIARLDDERKALEASSDTLRELKAQLERKRVEIDRLDETRTKLTDAMGQLTASLRSAIEDLSAARELAGELSDEERDVCGPRIEQEIAALDEGTALSVHNANARQRAVRERLQASIDADQRRIDNLSERLVERMQNYKRDYPAETTEVDSNLAALPDYATRLGTLRSEDLPRHEQRFKQLLNEGTIQDVALFQNQLDKEKREIERKIGTINQSLRAIEYNPGTYIELVTDPAQDTEVREFQGDLRACLAHSLSEEDELYDEQRFLKVKALIDRFNGRESLTELDRRWTRKVTDVRNWFNFSAEERWREDDSVREYYSDSAGKSGGQKEKLAYTILASALAYQFGLEWNAIKSRSFRFVMIDEAFGRGSDESTRYALELFKKLNLQLLIVTPLQKIQIIEAYVAAVHFIHNEDGRRSLVRNLTIEQYRQEKRRYLEGAAE
ncbi:MAG: ATP-binding protein, partial [Gammaproteobacteria bacterium]